MILQDKEIDKFLQTGQLIEHFNKNNLTNIGYDLRAKYFAVSRQAPALGHYILKPMESVFVGAEENIRLPDDLVARVVLKNSRIRQGLTLDAPVYQPGHHTKVFYRLTNVSGNEIELHSGDEHATIMFEQLCGAASTPYKGTFSEEMSFSGMADYESVYHRQIHEIEKKTEDLKELEKTIYADMLVILTVFIVLFTFLTTNVSMLAGDVGAKQFIIQNLVMLGCISFLVGILNKVIKRNEKGCFTQVLIVLAGVLLGIALCIFKAF